MNVREIQQAYRCRSGRDRGLRGLRLGLDAVDLCHVVALSMLDYRGSAAATRSLHASGEQQAMRAVEDDVGVERLLQRWVKWQLLTSRKLLGRV